MKRSYPSTIRTDYGQDPGGRRVNQEDTMTERDTTDQALLDTSDISAEPEDLTSQEAAQMDAREGRGARQVPGAEASDEYVAEHTEGTNDPAAKNANFTRDTNQDGS